jgi:3-isopropylmalate/(R)-2-methylmalate dehydratase small subunit
VISTSFADIFANNALKNSILPVTLSGEDHREVIALLKANPGVEFSVDLSSQTLIAPEGRSMPFPIDSFAKTCLLNGVDELGYLLRFMPEIEAFEQSASRG